MPWKIRNINLTGENPIVQIFDRKNRIYMDIEMSEPREVHIYTGNNEHEGPEEARVHIVVDEEGILVAHAKRVSQFDIMVVNSILETMGHDSVTRKRVSKNLNEEIQKKAQIRKGVHLEPASDVLQA